MFCKCVFITFLTSLSEGEGKKGKNKITKAGWKKEVFIKNKKERLISKNVNLLHFIKCENLNVDQNKINTLSGTSKGIMRQ